MEKPYLSVVAMARNDDYGGNWINRINAFLKVLAYQAERTGTLTEMVFVEYNPVEGKPFLYQSLAVPKNSFFEVRFIVVPKEFHRSLPDNEKVPICEFIAKNIGARRAKGEWIVATNPDTLWSNELFDFIASKKLDPQSFYRINRRDLSTNFVKPELRAQEILEDAEKNVIKILYNDRTIYVSMKEWFSTFIHGRTWKTFLLCPLFNALKKVETDGSVMHQNAAGDFLLAHKDAWSKVRGYDQVTVGSGVLDGYILYVLYCHGFKQRVIPHALYHIYHHHKGVKYLASHAKYTEDAKRMLETKIPYKENSEDWGFSSRPFSEIIL